MNRDSLRQLEHHDAFLERHIGPNDAEIAHMLRTIGHESLESLTDAIVPGSIKSAAPLALPEAISEVEAIAKIRAVDKPGLAALLAEADRFGVGTAKRVIEEVRAAVLRWPEFAQQADLPEAQMADIQALLLPLGASPLR